MPAPHLSRVAARDGTLHIGAVRQPPQCVAPDVALHASDALSRCLQLLHLRVSAVRHNGPLSLCARFSEQCVIMKLQRTARFACGPFDSKDAAKGRQAAAVHVVPVAAEANLQDCDY